MVRLGTRVRCLLVALAAVAGALVPPSVAGGAARGARAPAAPACSSGGGGISSGISFFGAGRELGETNIPACVRGALTITFSGDPATGCAAHGLCGYSGSEAWQPQGVGELDLTTTLTRGHRTTFATFLVGGGSSPVRSAVERMLPSGDTSACSDAPSSFGFSAGFGSAAVHGGRITLGLVGAGPALVASRLLGTRCAGPLDPDVRAALPVARLPLARVARGRLVVNLSGARPFAAHGFAGVVRSTLVLTLGRPTRSRPPRRAPTVLRHGQHMRQVSVDYRVQSLTGEALAAVRTSTDSALCGPFDACGLRGAITVRPGAARGSFQLDAIAPARRPYRDLLAAVGIGHGGESARISANGFGQAAVRGTVAAALTQSGACRDAVALPSVTIQVQPRAGRLHISLAPQMTAAADPLRTRCPGPDLGQHPVAVATLPRAALRRPTLTVALRGTSLADGPYRVSTRSTLRLTLRRVRVTRHAFTIPAPPVPGPTAATATRPPARLTPLAGPSPPRRPLPALAREEEGKPPPTNVTRSVIGSLSRRRGIV